MKRSRDIPAWLEFITVMIADWIYMLKYERRKKDKK